MPVTRAWATWKWKRGLPVANLACNIQCVNVVNESAMHHSNTNFAPRLTLAHSIGQVRHIANSLAVLVAHSQKVKFFSFTLPKVLETYLAATWEKSMTQVCKEKDLLRNYCTHLRIQFLCRFFVQTVTLSIIKACTMLRTDIRQC